MTLFDLAVKNIRRNMKDYGLYIGSMIFSIAIYFTFVTLKYSDDMIHEAGSSTKIAGIMNVSSVMLLIFIIIFIAYSNSFFMKKRKKEVALYSLLGVRKKQIGFLLFFENLVIGLFSLVVGIIAGFFASKGMLVILFKLMGFEALAGMPFSSQAVVNTMIVFLIVFLFTSLQGYRVIYQFKLIDLFHAEKKGEELPKARWITALLGVILLGAAYYFASVDIFTSEAWRLVGISMPLLIMLLTVAGTYLLFHSVTVYVLSKMKNNTRWAWRGLNLMTASQMLYRIRGNAKTLTLIAVLSATTITAGGAVFGLYYNVDQDTSRYMPNTFMWQGEALDIKTEDTFIQQAVETKTLQMDVAEMTYEYTFLSESTYNKLAEIHGLQQVDVQDSELFLIDPYYDERFSQDYTNLKLPVQNQSLIVKDFSVNPVLNTSFIYLSAVVTDELFAQMDAPTEVYQIVNMDNEKDQLALSQSLQEQLGGQQLSSFPQNYADSIQSLGVLLFVGSFLGLVFLVATGSIIYFKMMTEAEEDRDKYEVLHKIGVNNHEMKKTIRAQVGIIFGVPLVVGIVHAAFALIAFSNLLALDITTPVVIWVLAYSGIYAIYYVLTVRYFNKTIKQNFTKVG
ncbi:MAG: ABC transporter permease [Solibacillus sp.]